MTVALVVGIMVLVEGDYHWAWTIALTVGYVFDAGLRAAQIRGNGLKVMAAWHQSVLERTQAARGQQPLN